MGSSVCLIRIFSLDYQLTVDSRRKDFSDKAQEKVTPDSSKSTYDKVSETVTDTADKAARQVVPGRLSSDNSCGNSDIFLR